MASAGDHRIRRLAHGWTRRRRREDLALLYAPDPGDLDLRRHLDEAMAWLKRAQDSGPDRGVSYGVQFGQDWDVSYPETTGYICRTFVEQGQHTDDRDLLERAVAMGDWEIALQLPEGAVMGGKANAQPTPAVFNTGMVLLGWSALVQQTGHERFKQAARRAGDWLVSMQDPDGSWTRGNSRFAVPSSTLYNVKAAWGLCEAGLALEDEGYVQSALRNAEHCLERQRPNGWFPDCCLTDAGAPLLHTLAYSMQGLLGIGKLTGRDDLIEGARLLADAQIRIMGADGFLPGRQSADLSPAADWCCLTGSAQTSIVWTELYLITREDSYRESSRTVNRYLMARHDIRNVDSRLRGAVPGSWPVWSEYAPMRVLNWATKFLVDALWLELRSLS
jgi:hypothetical protein